MVVDADCHSLSDGCLADETSQEIFRSQETRLKLTEFGCVVCLRFDTFFSFFFFKSDFAMDKMIIQIDTTVFSYLLYFYCQLRQDFKRASL